jgi:hypothetical protein
MGVSARTLHHVSPRSAAFVGLLALAATVAGCGTRVVSTTDSGPPGQDDAGDPLLDTDRDGLCDSHERSRGLRVDATDTDMDGYSDLAEVSLGSDPLAPASPAREEIVVLREAAGGTARVTFDVNVRGAGESYEGAFQSVRTFYDDGTSASSFFEGASAIGAVPMANVFGMDRETFFGVNGRTTLVFEIRFAHPSTEPRGCMRAYPFRYSAKRADGRIVGVRSYTLVVAPDGMMPGAGTWCAPEPCY